MAMREQRVRRVEERNEDDSIEMQDRREEGTQMGTIVEIMRMMMVTLRPDGNMVIVMKILMMVVVVIVGKYGALAFVTRVVSNIVALLVVVVAVCIVV